MEVIAEGQSCLQEEQEKQKVSESYRNAMTAVLQMNKDSVVVQTSCRGGRRLRSRRLQAQENDLVIEYSVTIPSIEEAKKVQTATKSENAAVFAAALSEKLKDEGITQNAEQLGFKVSEFLIFTGSPTAAPSKAPTQPGVTYPPTHSPTKAPTAVPSSTLDDDDSSPTLSPTASSAVPVPSNNPVPTPTPEVDNPPSKSLKPKDPKTKPGVPAESNGGGGGGALGAGEIAGIVIGCLACAGVVVLVWSQTRQEDSTRGAVDLNAVGAELQRASGDSFDGVGISTGFDGHSLGQPFSPPVTV